MTDLSRHVPTLATCQKLKEAGFTQASYLVWHDGFTTVGDPTGKIELSPEFWLTETEKPDSEICAAPILTEILEQLPERLTMYKPIQPKTIYKFFYEKQMSPGVSNCAEAAALLWLKLQEAHA